MSGQVGTEHLLCANCRNHRWVVDFGFGRLCGPCDQARAANHGTKRQRALPVPMPVHAPARPFSEPAEPEEEAAPW